MTGLFPKAPAPPPTPAVAYAPPMPDITGPSVQEAQTNSAVAAMQRQGRASTILGKQGGSNDNRAPAPTAADTYSGTKLGTAQ